MMQAKASFLPALVGSICLLICMCITVGDAAVASHRMKEVPGWSGTPPSTWYSGVLPAGE